MGSRHLHHSCLGPQCCVSAWPCHEERLPLRIGQEWSRACSCGFIAAALLSSSQTAAPMRSLRGKEGKCPREVRQPHNRSAPSVPASDRYTTHLSHTAISFPRPGSLFRFVIHHVLACCSSSSNYTLSSVSTSGLVLVEVTWLPVAAGLISLVGCL